VRCYYYRVIKKINQARSSPSLFSEQRYSRLQQLSSSAAPAPQC